MFGLLNVCKPQGCTSRDVVNQVQRLVKPVKVGHAGTLDPLASGVLVLGVGPATRLVPFIHEQRKCYSATFLLGRRSATDDIEGDVVECDDNVRPTPKELESAIAPLLGDILQRPPDYSAVKIEGQRAYAVARRGETVELSARPVSVYAIAIRAYQFPELRLDIECGSGTYVRAIGRDLAASLGTSAVMSELTRTAIGSFRIEQATNIEMIDKNYVERFLLPPVLALQGYPIIHLSPDQVLRISHGQFLHIPNHGIEDTAAAVDSHELLIAILRPQDRNHLRPDIVFQRA